jgi:hypothetical protein
MVLKLMLPSPCAQGCCRLVLREAQLLLLCCSPTDNRGS